MAQESLGRWRSKEGRGETALPDSVLSMTIRGPWGHFRRIEGNVVKQTYRIIPRTTVAGIFAAIIGIGRDEYYSLFGPDQSAIAIEPVQRLRTLNMPMNTLTTADEGLRSINSRGKISIELPDPTKARQQHNYEVLVEPAYRIDVALADTERYHTLKEYLASGKSHYVPSLGLSEYLAEVEYHGEFEVTSVSESGPMAVDSAVPNAIDDVVPESGTRMEAEESPAFMTADDTQRRTTGFTTYTYNPDAGPLTVENVTAGTVDGRTVAFV